MRAVIERDQLIGNFKVWFIEGGPYGERVISLADQDHQGPGGTVWQATSLEEGVRTDVQPFTLSGEMAAALRHALNETELPRTNGDVTQTLLDVLRNENERNALRVDKMIDSLIRTTTGDTNA